MSDKFERQADFVPRDKVTELHVGIIGVGAIGRQEALMLAAMGFENITLCDFDLVEDTNCTTQMYPWDGIGKPKVEVTAEDMVRINPDCKVNIINDRFRAGEKHHKTYDIVFFAVDQMNIRSLLYKFYSKNLASKNKQKYRRTGLLVDVRMKGEDGRLLCAYDDDSWNYYGHTLFTDEEADEGRCTARATIYTAQTMSSLAVQQAAAYIRGSNLYKDRVFGIKNSELFTFEDPRSKKAAVKN